jgi:hypothetical protein
MLGCYLLSSKLGIVSKSICKITPSAYISIDLLNLAFGSNISGAKKPTVPIFVYNTESVPTSYFAASMSQTLMWSWSKTKILWGFRSRWTILILLLCKYAIA